eukprot:COSAG03_NODE_26998_length_256_cov_0.401274_1_plen_35_part_01
MHEDPDSFSHGLEMEFIVVGRGSCVDAGTGRRVDG